MPTTHPPKRAEKASAAAGVGGARRKPKAQAKRPRQDDEDDSDEDPSDDEDVLGEVPAGAGQADGESYAMWHVSDQYNFIHNSQHFHILGTSGHLATLEEVPPTIR